MQTYIKSFSYLRIAIIKSLRIFQLPVYVKAEQKVFLFDRILIDQFQVTGFVTFRGKVFIEYRNGMVESRSLPGN